jgi:hypothetical protein
MMLIMVLDRESWGEYRYVLYTGVWLVSSVDRTQAVPSRRPTHPNRGPKRLGKVQTTPRRSRVSECSIMSARTGQRQLYPNQSLAGQGQVVRRSKTPVPCPRCFGRSRWFQHGAVAFEGPAALAEGSAARSSQPPLASGQRLSTPPACVIGW